MILKEKKVRALGLCSGGLDSILAGVVLREQGIDVEWVSFETPFFSADKAHKASTLYGIPLTVCRITDVYLEMLENPPWGYGKHMNPCMDCHALMFRLAGTIMDERAFDFLFSGEVLGQRPMSQTLSSLRYVEKHCGYGGRILRPLSAKRLAPTAMETSGLVDREKLLGLSGRGRKPQIALARSFGITEYPAPAGGCLLTDKGYSIRLRDLFQHSKTRDEKTLQLLKYGRHFRLTSDAKLIVGRTHADNDQIMAYRDVESDIVVKVCDYPGPTAIVPAGIPKEALSLAAAICAGYTKAPLDAPATVQCNGPGMKKRITVLPLPSAEARRFLI